MLVLSAFPGYRWGRYKESDGLGPEERVIRDRVWAQLRAEEKPVLEAAEEAQVISIPPLASSSP